MSELEVKRSDWVVCKLSPDEPVGFVRRVARDGSWADVRWKGRGGAEWSKRMGIEHLKVVTRIKGKMGDFEFECRDVTREEELKT